MSYAEETTKAAFMPTKLLQLSLNAVVMFLFLFSMTLGVQAGKLTDSSYAVGAVISVALAVMYFAVQPSAFFAKFGDSPVVIVPLIGLLLVFVSAVYSGELTSLIKVALLVVIFFVAASRVPSFSMPDLLTGFLIFAVVEFLFVVISRAVWNSNAFCNHIVFATFCGAAGSMGFRSRFSRNLHFAWMLAGFGTTFILGSRTAVVGLLISVGLYWAIHKGRMDRIVLRFIFVLGLFCAYVWSGDITGGVVEIAKRNLGSQNVVARFFLDDKNKKKIVSDFFDRREIWDAAYRTMIKNPFLGIGYDQPLPRMGDVRAHNAYLEIGYQCGVIAMLIWTAFYLGLVNYSASLIRFDCHDPVVYLAFTSSCYLVLAGLMESSGMMSLGTPGNWIAVSACAFLLLRRGQN